MAGHVIYVNVPSVRGDKDQSFEEIRVLDYLHSYQTTGRPPIPCPPQPTDRTQRATLGLPPLFEPFSERDLGVAPGASSAASPLIALNGLSRGPSISSTPAVPGLGQLGLMGAPPVANMAAQAFHVTEANEFGTKAAYQSLVAQREYAGYSPEECRVAAYSLGKKFAPEVQAAPPPPPQQLSTLLLPPLTSIAASVAVDILQSVNSVVPYDKHSFEELRLACIRAGRPLTSPEIIAQNAMLRLTV